MRFALENCGMSVWLELLLSSGTLPRSPHFVRVVHITGCVIHCYRPFAKHPFPSTTIPDSYATLWHNGEMSHNTLAHLMLPYCTERWLNHNLNIHCGPQLSVHANGTKFRGGNVSPDESQGYIGFSTVTPLPQRFPFGCDNLKNILVSTFKFGMWVYMGNATNTIVLWPWPSISRSLVAS